MIYQHRLVIARGGRLVQRHAIFQRDALAALEAHSSVLIGAWEVWIGRDAGCAVFQIRQFESLAAWEEHQEALRRDRQFTGQRDANLFPAVDYVSTSIVRLAERSPALPVQWPAIAEVACTPRAFYEQRTLYFRPDAAAAHHRLYFSEIVPALDRDGARLVAFFDTLIGPGTTNAGSHRSIELRRFPDLASWQRWREAQESDAVLAKLTKETWLANVERVESVLLRPLDYSRMR
jgi:hypothetical protein